MCSLMNSMTSAGAMPSVMAVKPRMSQNRTAASRTSPPSSSSPSTSCWATAGIAGLGEDLAVAFLEGEVAGHGVEGGGEGAELVLRAHPDVPFEVALPDPLGAGDQFRDRSAEAARARKKASEVVARTAPAPRQADDGVEPAEGRDQRVERENADLVSLAER